MIDGFEIMKMLLDGIGLWSGCGAGVLVALVVVVVLLFLNGSGSWRGRR